MLTLSSLLCSVKTRSRQHLALRALLTFPAPAGESLAALGLPGLPEGSGLPLHISGTPDSPSLEVAGCAPSMSACTLCHSCCTALSGISSQAVLCQAAPCRAPANLCLRHLPHRPPGFHTLLLPPPCGTHNYWLQGEQAAGAASGQAAGCQAVGLQGRHPPGKRNDTAALFGCIRHAFHIT